MQDTIFAKSQQHIVDFAFDEAVVDVFPDMIRRSVPGYELVIPMGGLIAARHMNCGATAFDLGCSLGASSLALLSQCNKSDVRIVGVDNSSAMIDQARRTINDPRMSFRCEDLMKTDISGARVVMLNFVVQFLDPEDRDQLLTDIAQQMDPAGLLLLSEKVQDPNSDQQRFFDSTHLAWKRANGYSEMEVSQKRQALENVMRVETPEKHTQRLSKAGFQHILPWFMCMNWVSFAASPTQVLHDPSE
ncbi:MAG TPA: carboxy-S-adenosyl-L-methionine synthase CmoA [Gammaproteobacteria bacterium]|nr:carboxy-S-adenosyl-L-methionine synthase CmoA [Gammaproteobacteria bacterium]